MDLDAVTGAVLWRYQNPTDSDTISSPAIAGAPGEEIVAAGDIGGELDVVSLSDGSQLYSYQTGGYITSSPAVSDGDIVISSSDGFLYDFAVGGGNDAILPTTAITSPSDSSTLTNPNGNLSVGGDATDSKGVAGVEIAVQSGGPSGKWWDGATQRWVSGPVDTRANVASPGANSSSWTFSFPVADAGGAYEVTAYAVSISGQADTAGAHVGFGVNYSTNGPNIEVSSAFVAPGAKVTLTVGGFNKSEEVAITLAGHTLATKKTNFTGAISSMTVKIPSNATFGLSSLIAVGESSGKSTSTAITIANSWEQIGDTAAHTGYEGNDTILNYLVNFGLLWVHVAWHFEAGAPIAASPVVADGAAYVTDTAGQLFALDIHNGGLLWSWELPSGDAINGSPAVDPSKGLVFVTVNDGTLDAISTSSGRLVWCYSVGGIPSAPVFGGGKIYVASSDGAVAARAESTGNAAWSKTLPSAVTGAPALDPSMSSLVLGEANGDIVALNASSGVTRWTYPTGGAVVSAALIWGGVVYVGSSNSKIYALSDSTGSKLWSYTTGGPVTDTGTLTTHSTAGGVPELLIGSGDGFLYALKASSGTLYYRVALHAPIVGVATVEGVVIVETSNGHIVGERTYADDEIWQYRTGAALSTAPAIVDGAIYVGAGNGNLYAFTSYGQQPV